VPSETSVLNVSFLIAGAALKQKDDASRVEAEAARKKVNNVKQKNSHAFNR
jgi:hypothetical protein